MGSDAVQLMGAASRAAAECTVAMQVANSNAEKAANAFEEAAKAQEDLGLNAAPYWANAAVFRGIAKAGKELCFSNAVASFLNFAEICDS